MTRLLSRFGLWLLGLIVPVFIAACYGVYYAFSKTGKVLDHKTGAGVEGIEVTCLLNGQAQSSDISGSGGSFFLQYDKCDQLRLTDVDGAQHGEYQPSTVPFCGTCSSLDLEVEAK